MSKKLFLSAIIMWSFIWPGLSFAKTETWEIDKAHASIYFDVKHIYSTVRGLFNEFSGSIVLDTENNEKSQVDFEVKVDSINTNITKRDDHLRSNDFFAAGKYPLMTFKSTKVKHVKDNQYILSGNLIIKGISKEVEVPFTYLGMRENPLKKGSMVAGFDAEFTINPLDYGVGDGKFYEMGVIGKDVHILISLEVSRDK